MGNCANTFYDYLGTCPDGTIDLNVSLISGTTYYWKITDKFGNEYTGEAVATGTVLPITIADLPDGLLNVHAGQFLIELYKDEAFAIRVPLLFSKYYDGATFEVKHNTSNKSTLGAVKNDSWC
jgi:hypothetical protein